jgi:hypothetical protein
MVEGGAGGTMRRRVSARIGRLREGARPRGARHLALLALAMVLVGAAVVAWWPSAAEPEVDATTTDAPAPTPLGDSPPLEPTRLVWSAELAATWLIVEGDHLVAVTVADDYERHRWQGVTVYDLTTGAERWHYTERRAHVRARDDVSVVDGQVVVGFTNVVDVTEGDTQYGRRRNVRLDLSSGRVLDDGTGPRVRAVEVVEPGPTFRGTDADGGEMWSWAPSDRCAGAEQTAGATLRTDAVYVVELRCGPAGSGGAAGEDDTLAAVDIATGDELWRQRLPPGGTLQRSLEDGMVGVMVEAEGRQAVQHRRLGSGELAFAYADAEGWRQIVLPVADGECAVVQFDGLTECVGSDGLPLGDEPLETGRTGDWLAASADDRLVLVDTSEVPYLVLHRPFEDGDLPVRAELDEPPWPDHVAYQAGVLVVANRELGQVAVYADAG